MSMMISVIVPCYNEQESLPFFYDEMNSVSKRLEESVEMIFVDDGSKDGTLSAIKDLAKKDERVKYISFSRNFGKEAAIYAGLKASKGELVCMMDADLQDPPSLLPEMVDAIKKEGYDSVATRRSNRKGEPKLRSFFAKKFYKIMNRSSSTDLISGARDYRLMTRQFVNAVLSLSERNRFTKGMFGWVGFRTKWIDFENVERVAGKTKWSFKKLFNYAIDGIVAFSTLPLKFLLRFGVAVSVLGVLGIIASVILTFAWKGIDGFIWAIEIIGTLIGLQSVFLGIYGVYIEKIYGEEKGRPIYIEKESNID